MTECPKGPSEKNNDSTMLNKFHKAYNLVSDSFSKKPVIIPCEQWKKTKGYECKKKKFKT